MVVPFAGTQDELEQLLAGLDRLELLPEDTVTVVDNRRRPAEPAVRGRTRVLTAPERRSSYFARNRGVEGRTGEWIVMLDADVLPPPDLLDRFFDPAPAERTAVVAGRLIDSGPHPGECATAAIRWGLHRSTMSQHNTLAGPWGYAQTASCAVRRAAFNEVGGFREDIRSGGDADLCYRLRAAGWSIESREGAASVHASRRTLRRLVRQRLRHGSGAAWLNREYPGSAPGHGSWPGLVKWTFQCTARSALASLRGRREEALIAAVDLIVMWATELGRLLPNRVR